MKRLLLSITALLALAAAASPASADIVISTDPHIGVVAGEAGLEVKLYLEKTDNTQSFNANFGSQDGTPTFLFNTIGKVDAANGFSTVKPDKDATFTQLTIFAASGYTFKDFNFSILDAPDFTVRSSNGGVVHVSGDISNGNFDWTAFTLNVTGVADLTWVNISADGTGDFKQMKQFQISGLALNGVDINPQAAVPEPATWAMMILGFFGIGGLAMVKRRREGQAFRLV